MVSEMQILLPSIFNFHFAGTPAQISRHVFFATDAWVRRNKSSKKEEAFMLGSSSQGKRKGIGGQATVTLIF